MQQLAAPQLAQWLADPGREKPLVLDVREPWEVQTAALPGILHIPMREIPRRLAELDAAREVVCLCHHGGRSMQVAAFLEQQGYGRVYNLAGGIDAWSRTVDAAVPLY